ncbi:Thioredoxin-like protein 1 [Tulasnella sp. 330]|nr:Thioredoxin-like protein 1 [Tulasnella sp. 330]KAG8878011.1 Thioredoxin-like protein 1 [Tulasnella sp. 331]KAG8883576.1 Thioredoxin-like protein 1 [Tulasnella sp. 332]
MTSPFLKHVHSKSDMDKLLKEKTTVLVDFHAAWCQPCHTIAPLFSQLADQYKNVTFAKVDVDKVQSVAKQYGVVAMPTFVMIQNKQVVETLKGADRKGLEDLVKRYAPIPDAYGVASGSGSGDAISAGDVSLLEYLDLPQVNCLNESLEHTLKPLVENRSRNMKESVYLESDADEQLLITLVFNQVVRIRSLVLQTQSPNQGPKTIKLAINKPSIGFDDIEDAVEPDVVQVFDVPEDSLKDAKHLHLRFVRLQRVNSLHIFVASNHGGVDETRIDAIDVFGQPVATTQMSGLKKGEDE